METYCDLDLMLVADLAFGSGGVTILAFFLALHIHTYLLWTTSTIKFIHMYMYAEYSVPTTCLLLGNKARH